MRATPRCWPTGCLDASECLLCRPAPNTSGSGAREKKLREPFCCPREPVKFVCLLWSARCALVCLCVQTLSPSAEPTARRFTASRLSGCFRLQPRLLLQLRLLRLPLRLMMTTRMMGKHCSFHFAQAISFHELAQLSASLLAAAAAAACSRFSPAPAARAAPAEKPHAGIA